MKKTVVDEIIPIGDSIVKKIDAQPSIEKILRKKVDRRFPLDITQLSDNELDYEIYRRMTDLNENFFYVKLRYHQHFSKNRVLSLPLFNNKLVKFLFFPLYLLFFIPGHLGVFVENSILINQMLPHRHTRYRKRIQELESQVGNIKSQCDETDGSA